MFQKIGLFFKGLLMGIANKIPGVSGGMVAFVLGFYQEWIYTFSKINGNALKLLFKGKWRLFWDYTNAGFLSLILAGSITSYFTFSLLLDWLILRYPIAVWSVFFGLIMGSIYYTFRKNLIWSSHNLFWSIIGLSLGFLMGFIPLATDLNESYFFVFFCGFVSVAGMTIPGLSGSFLLFLLGNYHFLMIDTVNIFFYTVIDLLSLDFTVLKDPYVQVNLVVLAFFVLGSLTGLITTSRFLAYLLKHWKNKVNAIIIGFITGSLINIWPWKNELDKTLNTRYESLFLPNFTQLETWIAFLLMAIAATLVVLSYHYEFKNDKKNIRTDR